uniref:Repressor of RNA polymerase III transcription MAF1 homolog n=1 Tax=Macrostomum lignano TaxID=282301 RepID=A0A1I8IVN4_9PLAT
MKLLDTPKFDPFLGAIRQAACDYELDFRLENYSCKMISTDKRQFKKFTAERQSASPGGRLPQLQLLSPPQSEQGGSYFQTSWHSSQSEEDGETSGCGGPAAGISHKTLFFYLISTLNSSFFDYDFTCSRSFRAKSLLERVQADVDDRLGRCVPSYAGFRAAFWHTLDDEISLSDCDIYSYNPDNVSDPYCSGGVLWSFNYMFFNKKLKRIGHHERWRRRRPAGAFDEAYFDYDDDGDFSGLPAAACVPPRDDLQDFGGDFV